MFLTFFLHISYICQPKVAGSDFLDSGGGEWGLATPLNPPLSDTVQTSDKIEDIGQIGQINVKSKRNFKTEKKFSQNFDFLN